MPTPIFIQALAATAAAAGVAIASLTGVSHDPAYSGDNLERLTRAELAQSAWDEFSRFDRNDDKLLNVDEFAAMSVVKAELAHLNGFIAVQIGDSVQTLALPINAPEALSASEHVRINAVARNTFYAFAGADGKMDADDFIGMQEAMFSSADLNKNDALTKRELQLYAHQQAQLPSGV